MISLPNNTTDYYKYIDQCFRASPALFFEEEEGERGRGGGRRGEGTYSFLPTPIVITLSLSE